MNTQHKEITLLANKISNLLTIKPDLPFATMQRLAREYEEQRALVLRTQPAAFLALCKAYQISPAAHGAEIMCEVQP